LTFDFSAGNQFADKDYFRRFETSVIEKQNNIIAQSTCGMLSHHVVIYLVQLNIYLYICICMQKSSIRLLLSRVASFMILLLHKSYFIHTNPKAKCIQHWNQPCIVFFVNTDMDPTRIFFFNIGRFIQCKNREYYILHIE
jgi:hypothetical protein